MMTLSTNNKKHENDTTNNNGDAITTSITTCYHILSSLLQLESKYNNGVAATVAPFTNSSTPTNPHNEFQFQYSRMVRESIVDWYYKVIEHYNTYCYSNKENTTNRLPRDVTFIAIRLLDRVIPRIDDTVLAMKKNKTLQLLSITCLYIAIKVYYKKCGLIITTNEKHDFIKMSNGSSMLLNQLLRLISLEDNITSKQIHVTELWIMERIVNWCVCPLTPGLFTRCIIHCIDWDVLLHEGNSNNGSSMALIRDKVFQTSLILAELATRDTYFNPYNPSSIALTCAIVSCHLVLLNKHCTTVDGRILRAFVHLLKHTLEEQHELDVLCLKLFELVATITSTTETNADHHNNKYYSFMLSDVTANINYNNTTTNKGGYCDSSNTSTDDDDENKNPQKDEEDSDHDDDDDISMTSSAMYYDDDDDDDHSDTSSCTTTVEEDNEDNEEEEDVNESHHHRQEETTHHQQRTFTVDSNVHVIPYHMNEIVLVGVANNANNHQVLS